MFNIFKPKDEYEKAMDKLSDAYANAIKDGWNLLDKEFHLSDTFEKGKRYEDCKKAFKTVADKLIQVKPELKDWVELNFREFLDD